MDIFRDNFTYFFNLNLNNTLWALHDRNGSNLFRLDEISGTSDTTYHNLWRFSQWYRQKHGYVTTVFCIVGIITNILNIVVLTRKQMLSSTNILLTGLAIYDGLTMIAYLPFALWFYCLYGTEPTPERNTYTAAAFLLMFAYFSVVVHTTSILITLSLAVFRCIFIKLPSVRSTMCSIYRAKMAIFICFALAVTVSIPNFIILQIKGHLVTGTNSTIWVVTFKDSNRSDRYVYLVNFWMQAILVKLLPGIALGILSIILINTIRVLDKHRKKLKRRKKTNKSSFKLWYRRHNRKATLLALMFMFLLTEFPHGIINLLSATIDGFVENVYQPLGDLLDILALVNNTVNFLLYCIMSRKFRKTFISIFIFPLTEFSKKIGVCLHLLSPYTYVQRMESVQHVESL